MQPVAARTPWPACSDKNLPTFWASRSSSKTRQALRRRSDTAAVAKAVPDGYTLLMGTANLATNVALFAKLPYDASTALAPISRLTKVPVYVFANADSPVQSVKDMVALSKSAGDGLSYATAGTGSVPHLAGEMFKAAAGANIVHIPYKGSSEAVTALLGHQVNLSFDNLQPINAYLAAKKVRVLAVTTAERSALLPDVPTMKELGYPIDAYSWWGVLAPAGTPPADHRTAQQRDTRSLATRRHARAFHAARD